MQINVIYVQFIKKYWSKKTMVNFSFQKLLFIHKSLTIELLHNLQQLKLPAILNAYVSRNYALILVSKYLLIGEGMLQPGAVWSFPSQHKLLTLFILFKK